MNTNNAAGNTDLEAFRKAWQGNAAGNNAMIYPKQVFPQQTCPNCGYCPHCGRGGYYRTLPYVAPYPASGPSYWMNVAL